MVHSCQNSTTSDDLVSPCCPFFSDKGFTLIETIAVLLLLGILAAIAVSRSSNFGAEADVVGASEVVKNHLRYAQTKAMNADVSWGINFDGSTYTLQNASGVEATLPGDLPQGMAFTATIVMFDHRWGSPVDNTDTPLTDDVTITISKTGASPQKITVTKNTGFIQ